MSKRPLHSTVTWQFSADNSELDPTAIEAHPQASPNRRASAGNVLGSAKNAPLLSEKRRRLLLLAHFHNKNVSSSDHSREDLSEIAKNDGELSQESSLSDIHVDNEENRPLSPLISSNKISGENVNITGINDHNRAGDLNSEKSACRIEPIDCHPSTSALVSHSNSASPVNINSHREGDITTDMKPKSFSAENVTIRTKLKRPFASTAEEQKKVTENFSSNLTESEQFEFAPPAKKRHFPSTTTIKLATSSMPLLLFSSCPISASSASPLTSANCSFSSIKKAKAMSLSSPLSSVQFSRSSSVSSSMPTKYSPSTTSLEYSPGINMSPAGENASNSDLSPGRSAPSTSSFMPLENSSLDSSSISSNMPLTQSLELSVSNVPNVFTRHRSASTASFLNSSHSWKSGSSNREFKAATFEEAVTAKFSKMNDKNPGELLKVGGRNVRKPAKKKVNFGGLRVFYFNRTQGFDTVPMTGSVALGMENRHHTAKDYSFFEFNKSNRRENIAKCASWRMAADSEIRRRSVSRATASPNSSDDCATTSENLSAVELNNNLCGIVENIPVKSSQHSLSSSKDDDASVISANVGNTVNNNSDTTSSSAEGLKMDKAIPPNNIPEHCSSSSDFSSDEDVGDEFAQLECQFQPIRSRIRKTILKTSGISIDKSNRDEYKKTVQSRTACGCDCVGGVCEAETCACAKVGVGCQVDRPSYPCTCTSDSQCKNPEGRIEFDPLKVHTHFLQTIMRLKVIQKRGLENSSMSVSPQHIKFSDSDETKKEPLPLQAAEHNCENTTSDQPTSPSSTEETK